MNFYILISKNNKKAKKWVLNVLFITLLIGAFIISFNFLIDPYNVTKYNLLNIEQKFARDDRNGKLNTLRELDKFDNIMFGSSRVYSINPRVVSQLIGGRTYNLGVSGACVEDHLGLLLWLKRNNKLPNTLIIGVDFYTFNPYLPPKRHFLENEELNFLLYSNKIQSENDISKFISLDATRASMKTFKNHLKKKKEKPRFDKFGWNAEYFDNSNIDPKQALLHVKKEIDSIKKDFYSDYKYTHLDNKRIKYYEKIKIICKQNNIKLYIFTTPLHKELLLKLRDNQNTLNALKEFIKYLSTFDNFTNFYVNQDFNYNPYNFTGATHTTPNAGDEILKILLKDKD